jgi:hypothetical protein
VRSCPPRTAVSSFANTLRSKGITFRRFSGLTNGLSGRRDRTDLGIPYYDHMISRNP